MDGRGIEFGEAGNHTDPDVRSRQFAGARKQDPPFLLLSATRLLGSASMDPAAASGGFVSVAA
jgi:hypothetical protein